MPANDHISHFAFQGDLDRVREMLLLGVDPNAPNEDGYSPLHNAIENGNIEVVRVQLEAGADPNAEDARGWSPLSHTIDAEADAASQLSHFAPSTEILELLLRHGADPNRPESSPAQRPPRQRTPLRLARAVEHSRAERLLIEAGAID